MAKPDPNTEVRRDRFREFCRRRGWANDDGSWKSSLVGHHIGKAAQKASDLLNGKGSFGAGIAREIEEALHLPRFYFDDGGTESTPIAPLPAREPSAQYLPGFEPLHVPLLANSATMGDGAEHLDDDVIAGSLAVSPTWVTKHVKPLTRTDNLRFIHAYGDSMEPTFSNGDILLVDAGVHAADIDGVYVLSVDGKLFVKRVTRRFDGVHDVTSDNPKVKTVQQLNGDGVTVCGRVVWAWNGRKL